MDIKGKAAVITGGASGIGLGIGAALVEKGARVMLADIEEEKAHQAAKGLGDSAQGAKVDVGSLQSVEALAQKAWDAFGQVDMLFNNAGVGGRTLPSVESDPEEVDWIINVNLKGVWRGISVFGKKFIAQKTPAAICNTASEHALGLPHLRQGVYNATKHAVLGLSDVVRNEMPDYVKVSVFCPGLVATKIAHSARFSPQGPLPPKAVEASERFMAQGMKPKEIGDMVVAGIEREDFFIVTHPHVVKFAEKRWQEISAAFEAQAPYTPESEKYNVQSLLDKLSRNRS